MSHQQSDKHGPAVDDGLTDDRRAAPAGTRHGDAPEDDPNEADMAEVPVQPADVDQRSEVARFLGPAAFPAEAEHIRQVAEQNHATEEVKRLLDRLPDGDRYETVEDVWKAIRLFT